MLKEKNGFLLKGDFVYVSTLRGLLGVHLENEQIILTHHIPNMVAMKRIIINSKLEKDISELLLMVR